MRSKKYAIATIETVLKGIGLIVLLWVVNTFIAFAIFNRDTDIAIILPLWFVADAIICVFLAQAKKINRWTGVGSFVFIMFLVVMYIIPTNVPTLQEARELNQNISSAHEDKYAYAKELFSEVEGRWISPTRQYLLEPHKVFFIKDGDYFWKLDIGEYVDSNVQAHIYRGLLLESGRFGEKEIVVEQHWCTNSPHGVVAFQIKDGVAYADLWAVDNFIGYKFGQYTAAPCDVLTGEPF